MIMRRRDWSFRAFAFCRIYRPFLLFAFGVAGFYLLGHLSNRTVRAQATATPFTMTTDLWDYSRDSKGKLLKRETTARRSDGATVQIEYDFHHGNTTMRYISLLDGRRFSVFDLIHGVIEWPPSLRSTAAARERVFNPPPNCLYVGEYVADYGTLLDEQVVILRMLPKGSSGTTSWRAPKLGCEALQSRTTQVQMDGSFKLLNESRLVTLKIGEPDPALFEVPATYRSLTPSQAQEEMATKLGLPWTKEMVKLAQQQDAAYYGHPILAK